MTGLLVETKPGQDPEDLPEPPSLHGARLQRKVPLDSLTAGLKKDIARLVRVLEKRVERELRRSGILAQVEADAQKRQEKAGPIGRGGIPLGPERDRALERTFAFDEMEAVARLLADEEDAFRIELESTLGDSYEDFFNKGGKAARIELGASGSFKLRNTAIADALKARANHLAGDIAEDVFDRMKTVIADGFYLEGRGILEVARALRDEFDWLSKVRSERIARTETLSVTEEAQHTVYKASGVHFKRWITTLDGRERETHFEAHGQLRAIDEPFDVGQSLLMYPGDPDGPPEEIINCFPGNVRMGGLVSAALRVRYAGPMREIVTAEGRRLSVTPNHPILTLGGFLAAKDLSAGDYVLCDAAIGERSSEAGRVNHEPYVPPTIEQVFDTFRTAGRLGHREVSVDDFHGDAAMMKGQVDVIRSARFLSANDGAEAFDRKGEPVLVGADMPQSSGASNSPGGSSLRGVGVSAAGFPGAGTLPLDRLRVALEAGPLQTLRLGAIADLNASRYEVPDEGLTADVVLVGKLLHRGAGQVVADQVVEVRDHEFSGQVFDLQSPLGWIVADGFIGSNCRCATQPVVTADQVFSDADVWRGDVDPDEFARDREEIPDELTEGPSAPPPTDTEDLEFADEEPAAEEDQGDAGGEGEEKRLARWVESNDVEDLIDYVDQESEMFRRAVKSIGRRELADLERYLKAEREYERDERGRFGTGGTGGSEGEKPEERRAAYLERLAAQRRAGAELQARIEAARAGGPEAIAAAREAAAQASLERAAPDLAAQRAEFLSRPAYAGLSAEVARQVVLTENAITKNDYETAAIIDKDGERIAMFSQGHPTQVGFGQHEQAQMRGAVVTHNHPTGRSFSKADIGLAAQNRALEMRAAGNDGTVYRMSSTRGETWPGQARISRELNLAVGEVDREMKVGQAAGLVTLDQANQEWNHRAWEIAAPRLGLNYVRDDSRRDPERAAALPRIDREAVGRAMTAERERYAAERAGRLGITPEELARREEALPGNQREAVRTPPPSSAPAATPRPRASRPRATAAAVPDTERQVAIDRFRRQYGAQIRRGEG